MNVWLSTKGLNRTLGGPLETVDLAQPADQWVPTRKRLVHQTLALDLAKVARRLATSALLVLRDAIEVFSTAEVEFVADHGWGSVEAVVELVEGQQLELRAARDDGDAAIAPGDVYASGGAYG